MILQTKRLILKPITDNDRYDIFKYFDHDVTRYMYPKPAQDISETDAFIKSSVDKYEQGKEIVFVARLKDTDEFIGCMGIHHLDTKTPEFGIWIKKEAHHHGFGFEGIKKIYDDIQSKYDHDYFIYPVDFRNIPSRNIPELMGGIPSKRYQIENSQGFMLDIIEYFIYKTMPNHLKKPIILFQGDSVTDANRLYDNVPFGHGYVYELTKHVSQATIINHGISGNRTTELLERWNKDTIDIQPDFISILVGINDVWHKHKWNKPMTSKQFKENYIKLLDSVKASSPKTIILLIEPFAFPIREYESSWDHDLIDEQKIIKELADTYKTLYIPMQHILNMYLQTYSMEDILGDGVHPTTLGHQIIEKEVRKVIRHFIIDFYLNQTQK